MRTLAIEPTGDFYRRKIAPAIRLRGKWLEKAGFLPRHRVAVTIVKPGTLQLDFVDTREKAPAPLPQKQ